MNKNPKFDQRHGSRFSFYFFLLSLVLGLSGCALTPSIDALTPGPPLSAEYSALMGEGNLTGQAPGAETPYSPPPGYAEGEVTYSAQVSLEVRDPERAAEKAEDYALEAGGYLIARQIRRACPECSEEEVYVTVVLNIPAESFWRVYDRVVRLGEVVEALTPNPSPTRGEGSGQFMPQGMVQLVVNFEPESRTTLRDFDPLRGVTWPDWRPLRTLSSAWEVFATIFLFLLDVVIWLAVVVGPFVLLFWVVRRYVLRKRE